MTPQPVAYGYVCVPDEDEAEIERQHDLLKLYAQKEGMALEEVYVDRSVDTIDDIRPALSRISDHVQAGEGIIVLIEDTSKLMMSELARKAIIRNINELGGHLIALADVRPATPTKPLPERKPGTNYSCPGPFKSIR